MVFYIFQWQIFYRWEVARLAVHGQSGSGPNRICPLSDDGQTGTQDDGATETIPGAGCHGSV